MSVGIVKRMRGTHYTTPNSGVLTDLDTGIDYSFSRPALGDDEKPHDWNVKTHDLVTFTLTNGVVSNVVLARSHDKETVYTYTT